MAKCYGNRWEVVRSIGTGGQSEVFLVKDLQDSNQKEFALKRFRNVQRISRFETEVEALLKLDHPHIIRIEDYDLDPGTPFVVMEYCRLGNLTNLSRGATSDYESAFEIFDAVCDALQYAHNHNVVHRDIKPANILRRDDGAVVVADFGICYIDDNGTRHTLTDEAVGARGFTAPELESGPGSVTSKADVYSAGKLLHWLFSGRDGVPPREDYTHSNWDLRRPDLDAITGYQRPELHHVNDLLSFMIHELPSNRRSMGNIRALAKQSKRELLGGYSPVGLSAPLLCRFCGAGKYVPLAVKDATDVGNFGLNAVGSSAWIILRCSYCSHIELFKPDSSERWSRWSSEQF